MSTVTTYLRAHDVEFLTFDHIRTETAAGEARTLGVAPGEVAKTIVLDTPAGHALAVIPASKRLDLHLVADAIGSRPIRLAAESEIAADFPGFDLGAIPPLSGLLGVPVYIDEELVRHEAIVFASGKQTESVKMRTSSFLADEMVVVAPICRDETSGKDWIG